MKVVPLAEDKASKDYRREADILKSLNCPGIPTIYDLEEIAGKLYIIEEYIDGETLYERINHTGTLSSNELIYFAISLCQPIKCLHNQEIPIYHLDLHPNNVILKDKQTYLIDFDHALFDKEEISDYKAFGREGFAAPEQYKGPVISKAADLYSFASILYYAATGLSFDVDNAYIPECLLPLEDILLSCLSKEEELRYESIEKVEEELKKLLYDKESPSQSISVVGLGAKVGTSSVALNLAFYLKMQNLAVIYEEHNKSKAMQNLAEYSAASFDRYAYFRFCGINIRPWYDEVVKIPKRTAAIYIKDYGKDIDRAFSSGSDLVIIVLSSAYWDVVNNLQLLGNLSKKNYRNYIVVFNLYKEGTKVIVPECVDVKSCYKLAYFSNITKQVDENVEVYKSIMEKLNICGKKEAFISRWLNFLKERLRR